MKALILAPISILLWLAVVGILGFVGFWVLMFALRLLGVI